MKRKQRVRKVLTALMAFIMIISSVTSAYAASGSISEAKQIVIDTGGITWSFKVTNSDGAGKMTGTCMEPGNDTISLSGTGADLTKLSNSSNLAKLAYLGSKSFSTNKEQYIVSRAAARIAGNVPYNNYAYYEEVNALVEKAKDSPAVPSDFEAWLVDPNGGGQDILAWRTLPNGKLDLKKTIDKTDSDTTAYSLTGAEYGVYSDSSLTNKIGTLKTDEKGNTNELSLKAGTYYIKETKAPSKLQVDSNQYKAVVSAGETTTIKSVEKPILAKASIKKVIGANSHLAAECPQHYTLAGAEYTIYRDTGLNDVAKVLTTDKDGNTDKVNLKPGKYYIKETKAPKGLAIDKTKYTVNLTAGSDKVITSEDLPLFDPMKVLLEKKDEQGTGMPITGAEFTVKYYKQLTEDTAGFTPARTWIFKTDEKGVIALADKYKIGGDELYKDDKGAPAGLIGTYEITETKAPKGYALMKGKIIRQVTKNGTKDETLYNVPVVNEKPQTVSLTLNKIDAETGKNIPQGHGSFEGAIYGVYRFDAAGNKDVEVGRITTDTQGTGALTALKPGTYRIKELKAPKGYLKSNEEITVEAAIKEENTANFSYTVNAKESPIITEISKKDATTGDEIPGAKMKITDKEGKVIEIWTSGNSPHIIKGLPAGSYILHEEAAPDGYLLSGAVEFAVKADGNVNKVEMKDERPLGIIRLQKEGELLTGFEDGRPVYAKAPLEGAEFTVTAGEDILTPSGKVLMEKGTTVDTLVTDAEGKAQTKKLLLGKYIVTETKVPEGYRIDSTPVTAELLYEDQKTAVVYGDVTATNYMSRGSFELTKKDLTTDEVIPGAEFVIRDSAGNTAYTGVTDENGVWKTDNIPYGKYTYQEISAPQGYLLDDTVFNFEITKDGEVVQQTVTNTRPQGTILLQKTGEKFKGYEQGKPSFEEGALAGAKFEVIAAEDIQTPGGMILFKAGEKTADLTTDKEGKAILENLNLGKYIVRETKAPKGYVLDNQPMEVVLNYADQNTEVIYASVQQKNDYIKGNLQIIKKDAETGKPLEGAEFEIRDSEGSVVLKDKTDSRGRIETELVYGKYTVKEINAPKGYFSFDKVEKVEITENGQGVSLKFDNKKVIIPKTGDAGGIMFYGLVSLLAVMVLFFERRKKAFDLK